MAEDLEQRLRDGLEGVQGGPWHLDKHAVYIFAPAEKGGAFPLGDEVCGGRVMRLRGWGYYTGRGHGALALPEDEAAKRQRLTGEHIARCSPENIAALLDALSASRARSEALEKAAKALHEQWLHYREKTTLNQQDAYYSLAKGQWEKWDALAAALSLKQEGKGNG